MIPTYINYAQVIQNVSHAFHPYCRKIKFLTIIRYFIFYYNKIYFFTITLRICILYNINNNEKKTTKPTLILLSQLARRELCYAEEIFMIPLTYES